MHEVGGRWEEWRQHAWTATSSVCVHLQFSYAEHRTGLHSTLKLSSITNSGRLVRKINQKLTAGYTCPICAVLPIWISSSSSSSVVFLYTGLSKFMLFVFFRFQFLQMRYPPMHNKPITTRTKKQEEINISGCFGWVGMAVVLKLALQTGLWIL